MKISVIFPFLAALFALWGCVTPQTFARRAQYPVPKWDLLDATLQTLSERGEEIQKIDKIRGLIVTRPKDWQVDDNLIVRYQLTLWVTERGPASSELVVYIQGDKRSDKTGKIYMLDDRDPQAVGILQEVLSATESRLDRGPKNP